MAADPKAAPEAGGVEGLSFEQALERLETIVEELEGGGLTLEQSIARYEEGVKLSRRLGLTLDQAEKQIERLVEEDDRPGTEPADLDLKHPAAGGEGELPF
jgi:exodeoxyribonuclease VII small subunit